MFSAVVTPWIVILTGCSDVNLAVLHRLISANHGTDLGRQLRDAVRPVVSVAGYTVHGVLGAAVAVVPDNAELGAAHLASGGPGVPPGGIGEGDAVVAPADLARIAEHLQSPNGEVNPTAASLQKRVDVAILCAQLIAAVLP